MNPISLREVTHKTVRDVIGLAVAPGQERFVDSNAASIAEAHFNPGAWFRAIYAGDTPVGFVMLFDPKVPGAVAKGPLEMDEIFLWRLMVDGRYQGRGYARQALDLLCDLLRGRGDVAKLVSSYVPSPQGPEAFYLEYGFRKTGRKRYDGSENEIVLQLN